MMSDANTPDVAGDADGVVDTEVMEAELVTADLVPEELGLPEDPDQAVAVLVDALGTARSSADAYLDDLKRLAADFENFKKRAAREREDTVERSSQRVVASLLPVLDSLEQALAHDPQSDGERQMLDGLQGTFRQLADVLAAEGLEQITGAGDEFDPNIHEAVGGGAGDDLVVDRVLRTGYLLRGRVLRPAMVLVAPAEQGEE